MNFNGRTENVIVEINTFLSVTNQNNILFYFNKR